MRSRRQFIKAMGVLGGAILAPFRWVGRAQASTFQDTPLPLGAELYEGFVLLPEGAPLPDLVQPPQYGPPIVCGVGQKAEISERAGVTQVFNAAEELANACSFPVYKLSHVPDGLRVIGGSLLRHTHGAVYGGSIGYETLDANTGIWETTVTIGAQPDFARPFPLWSSLSTEHKDRAIVLEKVDYLPSAGIKVETRRGYVFLWIEDNILYTLVVEHSKGLEAAQRLISSLVKIG